MKKILLAGALVGAMVPAYAFLHRGDLKSITLERTPCFGACPTYKVTLRADGSVEYQGIRFVEKLGKYTARVNPEDVSKINEIVQKLEFSKMKDKYTANITDMPSALVTVDWGSKQKTTDNYGGRGPTELWAIEQLVDAVAAKAWDWKKVE